MLSKSLELGSCGVQWRPPDGAIGEHTDTSLVVTDDEGLSWHIQLHATDFAIGSDPADTSVLAEDLDLSARAAFEQRWRRTAARTAGAQPRSASPEWSPIIEAKLGRIGEGQIARVIHRLAYESGDETIVGHLIVPVEKGTVEIRIAARSTEAGTREQAIAAKHGGPQAQAVYDAADLDPSFPAHPLTRIRAALAATIDNLEIIFLPPARLAEIPLDEPGAAITPPPRFVAGPSVAGSGRGDIVRLGLDGWRRTIHVWRVGRHRLKGKDLRAALVEHADQDAATTLAAAGASQIVSRSRPIDDYGVCTQIQQYVTYERDALARHAIQRWWLAGDGTLWRIGTDATGNVDRNALLDELSAVHDSFRRI